MGFRVRGGFVKFSFVVQFANLSLWLLYEYFVGLVVVGFEFVVRMVYSRWLGVLVICSDGVCFRFGCLGVTYCFVVRWLLYFDCNITGSSLLWFFVLLLWL